MSDPDAIIRAELGPTENLLWTGRARRGIIFQAADRFWIPFALVWTGIVGYWLATFISQWSSEVVAELFLLSICLLPGLNYLVERFLIEPLTRRQTLYGVSSGRVILILVSETPQRVVRTVPLDSLGDVTLKEGADGSGTITLGPLPPWYEGTWGWAGLPNLVLKEETRKVYEIILEARRALKGR